MIEYITWFDVPPKPKASLMMSITREEWKSCCPQPTNPNCKSAARPDWAAEAEECSLKCNNRFGRLCRKYQDISPAVMQGLLLWVDITLFSSTGVPAPACNENVWQKMVAYSKVWIVCFLSNCKTALVHVRRFVYLKKNILLSTVKVAKTLMVFSPV